MSSRPSHNWYEIVTSFQNAEVNWTFSGTKRMASAADKIKMSTLFSEAKDLLDQLDPNVPSTFTDLHLKLTQIEEFEKHLLQRPIILLKKERE